MSQAQPTPPPRRRRSASGRGQLKPVEKAERRGRRGKPAQPASVTQLEERRRPKPAGGRAGLPRLPLFLAGLGLGYGLNGPIPHLATGLLAGLHHPQAVIGSLVAPAGMGDRRIVVLGTDHVSTNTDVMFTVQLKDGLTQLTQVPRDTFIDSEQYGVMKANAL